MWINHDLVCFFLSSFSFLPASSGNTPDKEKNTCARVAPRDANLMGLAPVLSEQSVGQGLAPGATERARGASTCRPTRTIYRQVVSSRFGELFG